MHPLEHLRYVARAGDVDPRMLVEETAMALRALAPDPAGLLLAVRRMLERHPDCGPLWVLCSRMLRADDPRDAARRTVAEVLDSHVDGDDLLYGRVCIVGRSPIVSDLLAGGPDLEVVSVDDGGPAGGGVRGLGVTVRASDAVVVEALALDADSVIVPAGSLALAAVARAVDVPVFVVVGACRRLPSPTLAHVRGMLDRSGGRASELLALADGDRLLTAAGVVDRVWSRTADCEAVAELLVPIPN